MIEGGDAFMEYADAHRLGIILVVVQVPLPSSSATKLVSVLVAFCYYKHMSGKLIFVSGFTGAGKTTLIGEALKRIDNIEVLLTHTTRPIRVGEESSYQYIFVDEEGYELAKNKSNNWDETIYSEFRYGSDAEKFINDLDSGINVIVSVTPTIDDIQLMESIYKVEPISIWINTSAEIAHSRVEGDIRRSSRVENDAIKNQFNIIYEPSGILDDDVKSFTELIYNIIS